jgi:hypothetical protein
MAETERVEINSAEEQDNPTLEQEYEAQQAAVQPEQSALPSDGEPDDRPEWLPEKFNSPEDLAKAYSELQGKMSSGETTEAEEVNEAAEQVITEAGLDFDALSSEYWENGGLSEESYEVLQEAGIPRELVDQYAQGQEALLESTRQQVYGSVGGEDNYESMLGWATDNLDDGAIDAFNTAVNSGDMNQTMMAVQGLQARYSADATVEPSRTVGGQPVTGGASYRSVAEMMQDMNDPRYQNDPAFRADVEQKLSRSNII